LVVLGDIQTTVPNGAAADYKAKELLQIDAILINGSGATGALSADSVHLNAYFGDVTGNGVINGLDTLTANSVATGTASGFAAYRLVDPALVGDVAGDFSVDGGDVSALDAFVALLAPPQIPVPPTGLAVTSPHAADPSLRNRPRRHP